jgi:hypothetical protein
MQHRHLISWTFFPLVDDEVLIHNSIAFVPAALVRVPTKQKNKNDGRGIRRAAMFRHTIVPLLVSPPTKRLSKKLSPHSVSQLSGGLLAKASVGGDTNKGEK